MLVLLSLTHGVRSSVCPFCHLADLNIYISGLMPHRLTAAMKDEPFASYRQATRTRLQELMLRDSFHPGHPLVTATSLHLEMSTADAAASMYTAPSLANFYQGCDLYYSVYVRPASPLSPQSDVPPIVVSKAVTV